MHMVSFLLHAYQSINLIVRIRSFMYLFFQFYFFGGALPYNDNPYGVTSGSYFNRPIFRYQNGVLAKNCYPIGRYIRLSVQ